jgi:hypothetical protein
VDAALRKSREATLAPQTGWSITPIFTAEFIVLNILVLKTET